MHWLLRNGHKLQLHMDTEVNRQYTSAVVILNLHLLQFFLGFISRETGMWLNFLLNLPSPSGCSCGNTTSHHCCVPLSRLLGIGCNLPLLSDEQQRLGSHTKQCSKTKLRFFGNPLQSNQIAWLRLAALIWIAQTGSRNRLAILLLLTH